MAQQSHNETAGPLILGAVKGVASAGLSLKVNREKVQGPRPRKLGRFLLVIGEGVVQETVAGPWIYVKFVGFAQAGQLIIELGHVVQRRI